MLVVGLLVGCVGSAATESGLADEVPVVAQKADEAAATGAGGELVVGNELRVETTDVVVAEAIIVPAQWSELRFEAAGTLAAVLVEEGNVVVAGDPLAQLETADLERALARAELGLRQAQLRLEQLQEPPDEAEIEIARAAVSDAAAAYQEARMNQTLTEHSVSVGDAVRAARFARDETFRRYQELVSRLGEDDPKVASAHDAYLDALGAYNRAVESAELQLVNARNEVTRSYHGLEQAQNSLDKLLEGADEADVKSAQLEVEAAKLSLESARGDLEKATLVAPFDGVVAVVNVDPGDAVMPGEVVLVLATLDRLQACTTDLMELDVVRVTGGQLATVTVDALPGQEFAGIVRKVALRPGDYSGDVVYTVTVELIESDLTAELRWGMTALVEITAIP